MSVVKVSRRGLLLIVTTVGVFLVGAATALACVISQGTWTVDNTANGGGSVSVIGDPGDGSKFMQWCNDPEVAPVQAEAGQTVDVSVGSSTDCNGDVNPNELPDGVYVVSFTNHAFTDSDGDGKVKDGDLNGGLVSNDCMAMPPTAATGAAANDNRFSPVVGTFTVQNGNGSGEARIPDYAKESTGGDFAGLCVTMAAGKYAYAPFVGGQLNDNLGDDGGPPIGNFAPVEITSGGAASNVDPNCLPHEQPCTTK